MNMLKKGFTPIIIVLIIALLATGAIGYAGFLLGKKSIPTSNSITTTTYTISTVSTTIISNEEFMLEGIVTFKGPQLNSYKTFRLTTCSDLENPYTIRYDSNTKIFGYYAIGGIHDIDNFYIGDVYKVKGIKTKKIDSACPNMIVYTATSMEFVGQPILGPDHGYCLQD